MHSFEKIIYLFIVLFIFSCSNDSNENDLTSDAELKEILVESLEFTNDLKFEEAYNLLQSLLKRAKKEENKSFEILANLNLGHLYLKFNEKQQALAYFLKSQDLSEEYSIYIYQNAIFNNIGVLYSENKSFKEAEYYFRKALKISREQKKVNKEVINIINIAKIKEETNQLDSALYLNRYALSILVKNNLDLYKSNIHNNIGEILLKEKAYNKALNRFFEALKLESDLGDQATIGHYEYNIGKTYVQLEDYISGSTHLKIALAYLKKANNSELISDCYYWLSKNEHLNEPSPLAQDYFDECIAWKDTVLLHQKDKWVTDTKLKFEFRRIEKENDFLEERATIQKAIILFIIIISLLFITFLISIWKSRTRNLRQKNIILNKEKELARVEMERNEAQKHKLEEEMKIQSQLNQIKEEKIKLDLEHKNKEVVSKAIHLMNKNEILNSLYHLVLEIDESVEGKNREIIDEMRSSIKNNLNQDRAWEDFKLHFEKVHESFISQLNQKHPGLSPTDFRLCAYLLIGLNHKEIAHVSNISPESVRKRKQRLRQKLSLDSKIEIEDYLKHL